MSGRALALILDAEPRLTGKEVKLSRSRDKWYAATPWSDAVTGSHPIAVLNQAFRVKGMTAGAELLEFFIEMRRFETMTVERRADDLVRVTIRNAERGRSAWPNMNGEGLTVRHLDAQYHDLRVGLYPLGREQVRAVDFAARLADEDLDHYELQLLRSWGRRWIRQQRRLAGDPEAGMAELDEHMTEHLARILKLDSRLTHWLVLPPETINLDDVVPGGGL